MHTSVFTTAVTDTRHGAMMPLTIAVYLRSSTVTKYGVTQLWVSGLARRYLPGVTLHTFTVIVDKSNEILTNLIYLIWMIRSVAGRPRRTHSEILHKIIGLKR